MDPSLMGAMLDPDGQSLELGGVLYQWWRKAHAILEPNQMYDAELHAIAEVLQENLLCQDCTRKDVHLY
jgi:hypothetical protein